MNLQLISSGQKNDFNKAVSHIIQSWQWGEFREKLGLPVLRYGLYDNSHLQVAFQLDLHKIPFIKSQVGYLPKGPLPTPEILAALEEIGKKNRCAFIKYEPNILKSELNSQNIEPSQHFLPSPHPYFTKFNYILDLTQGEEKILQRMHPKSRYNIKVAQKHGVFIEERTDDQGFEIHLKLYFDTTRRQRYLGHTPRYHHLMWETLKSQGLARVLIAFYKPSPESSAVALASWVLFNFQETLYYPYGGSSDQYRNVMAVNLLAWEAIRLGKKMNLKKFDLWGALGPDSNPNDPRQGFTKFKKNLGAELVEYMGSYDLILNKPLYHVFNLIDKSAKFKSLLLKAIGR